MTTSIAQFSELAFQIAKGNGGDRVVLRKTMNFAFKFEINENTHGRGSIMSPRRGLCTSISPKSTHEHESLTEPSLATAAACFDGGVGSAHTMDMPL